MYYIVLVVNGCTWLWSVSGDTGVYASDSSGVLFLGDKMMDTLMRR